MTRPIPGAETVTITGSYLDDVVIDTVCYEGTDPNAGPGRKHIIGITEVFGGVLSVERRCAMPYIMPEDGSIESITMYHNSMGVGNVRFGVYTGQSLPEPRIAQAWGTPIDYAEGWQTVNLIDPVFVEAGTKIWLAWLYENNPGIRYLDVDSSPGRAATFPKQTWSDPKMPHPFGPRASRFCLSSRQKKHGRQGCCYLRNLKTCEKEIFIAVGAVFEVT